MVWCVVRSVGTVGGGVLGVKDRAYRAYCIATN